MCLEVSQARCTYGTMTILKWTSVLLWSFRLYADAFQTALPSPIGSTVHLFSRALCHHKNDSIRVQPTAYRHEDALVMKSENNGRVPDPSRRILWQKNAIRSVSLALGISTVAVLTRPVWASSRSREDGYAVRKSEEQWKTELSDIQYFVLRQGGTERPGFSVLESEKRSGEFRCAGCGTPLFESNDKFNSGTGWPSFARGLAGVEVEDVDMLTAALSGAELRCKTCGGHLGDVFKDGFLFQGTQAAITGKRYCIDGAALVFYPSDGSSVVRGDQTTPKKLPSFLEPPIIEEKPKL